MIIMCDNDACKHRAEAGGCMANMLIISEFGECMSYERSPDKPIPDYQRPSKWEDVLSKELEINHG